MNLVSALISLSIIGAAAPGIAQMSIAPFEAQKRAENFGIAETAAVVFAATYEGTTDIPQNTSVCTAKEREGTVNAFSVTCTHGDGKYVQSVKRAFRLAVPDQDLQNGDGADTGRQFDFPTPTRFSGHSCPIGDEWGVYGHNDRNYQALGGACTPLVAWNQTKYQFSIPDAWLYDINNFNGWGHHPDYLITD